jgi:Ca2+-binding EF-hand superfamily protein
MGVQSMQQFKEKMFSKIDSDGSGGIDKTEFSDIAKKMSEMSGSSISVDDVFPRYDANGDNSLSMDELDSFNKDNPPPPPAGMQNAMSTYGMNMGSDQMSSLLDLLNNRSSDSKSGDTDTTNSIKDYISKLLETLGNKAGSEDTYSLVNVKA